MNRLIRIVLRLSLYLMLISLPKLVNELYLSVISK
nr:MAG TPA: hypothetical protein [Caudoviricetes sp.]